jgi:hypothetical protein
MGQFDLAVGDQIAGADVDVVARPAAEVFHKQSGVVVAPVELEACRGQPVVELLVPFAHRVVERDLELVHDPVRQRRERQIGLLRCHPGRHRTFGVEVAEADVHQGVRLDDMRRRPLHHGHVDAVLAERLADVVRGVVRPDDDGLLADVAVWAGVCTGVVLISTEHVLTGQRRHAGLARHPRREDELCGVQRDSLSVAVYLDRPHLRGIVERR